MQAYLKYHNLSLYLCSKGDQICLQGCCISQAKDDIAHMRISVKYSMSMGIIYVSQQQQG